MGGGSRVTTDTVLSERPRVPRAKGKKGTEVRTERSLVTKRGQPTTQTIIRGAQKKMPVQMRHQQQLTIKDTQTHGSERGPPPVP